MGLRCMFGFHDLVESQVWVSTWKCKNCNYSKSLLRWGCTCD